MSILRRAFLYELFVRVNMVAAFDVFSYLSTGFGWLLITYDPLRHISVYIGSSPREGEKKR